MLFNSLEFALFLPIVFFLYWFITQKNLKLQNALIVLSSYVFYGWWDGRFLLLIVFSTILDFSIGQRLKIEKNNNKRKLFLWLSIFINLGFLGFFKYYNFFLENFVNAFTFLGYHINANSLNIILPVGISFYTFQTLSYTIDVYKRKLEPVNDFIAFSAFVCFFPQLVAGPIERATNLLPQFYKKREFKYDKAVDGMRQILWGLFKKMVIADNCAVFANDIFNNYQDYNGISLIIGALFFTFQIYGDFSGYSDIAIGTSRLFGFDLKQNFAFPYFSRDIGEFWRRWHISLNTWFRDYLYIPLGGSKGGVKMKIRNTFAIFLVSGFWHGANWTFIVWGALNALYFLPLLLYDKNRKHLDVVAEGKILPNFRELISMLTTFILTVFAWIFFRAVNINHALNIIKGVFNFENLSRFKISYTVVLTVFFISILLIVEWINRSELHGLKKVPKQNILRKFLYVVLILIIVSQFNNSNDFIYFQF
jgi:D-alanyl-lipoteichoic acid acyltransferase DltB (MBOAT superfamily)